MLKGFFFFFELSAKRVLQTYLRYFDHIFRVAFKTLPAVGWLFSSVVPHFLLKIRGRTWYLKTVNKLNKAG